MNKVFCIIVPVLLALGAQAYIKDTCPKAVGKFPFDAEKFAGKWYVIAGQDDVVVEDKKCAKYNLVHFKSGDDYGYNVQYSHFLKDNKEDTYEGYFKNLKVDKPSAFYGVWKKTGEDEFGGIFKQTLIATDYDNYAVYIACKPEFDSANKTFGRKLIASILGRKTTINEDVKKTLFNVLSGYNVNLSLVKTIDHTNCKA